MPGLFHGWICPPTILDSDAAIATTPTIKAIKRFGISPLAIPRTWCPFYALLCRWRWRRRSPASARTQRRAVRQHDAAEPSDRRAAFHRLQRHGDLVAKLERRPRP